MEKVLKGWGHELIIHNCDEYCGKILVFNKGKKCSYHYHELKKETFYVLSGRILLKHGKTDEISEAEEIILEKGMKFEIERGLRHQMFALEDSEICEFSTRHFDEDSIRVIKGD